MAFIKNNRIHTCEECGLTANNVQLFDLVPIRKEIGNNSFQLSFKVKCRECIASANEAGLTDVRQ